MFFIKSLAIITAGLACFSVALPVEPSSQPRLDVAYKYIVTFNETLSPDARESHLAWVSDMQKSRRGRQGEAGIEAVYNISSFHAYTGTFDDDVLEKIKQSKDVTNIESDQIYTLDAFVTQPASPWGLGAICSRHAGATSYHYDDSGAEGTYAYVIDSGINVGHDEFGGRAIQGYNAVEGSFEDTYGHGTHVAGIIGGTTYGVAKFCNLIDVKVFVGRQSTTSTILDGFSWATNDVIAKSRQGRSVINLSFSGPSSTVWTSAVNAAYNAGILTVVASGNQGVSASTRSPANIANVLTVGALEEYDSVWSEPSYSNYGEAVDILAPGSDVESTSMDSTSATETRTGTSMAAPHVAGLALYLANLENISSPSSLKSRIIALATAGEVDGLLSGSPNKVAYNGYV